MESSFVLTPPSMLRYQAAPAGGTEKAAPDVAVEEIQDGQLKTPKDMALYMVRTVMDGRIANEKRGVAAPPPIHSWGPRCGNFDRVADRVMVLFKRAGGENFDPEKTQVDSWELYQAIIADYGWEDQNSAEASPQAVSDMLGGEKVTMKEAMQRLIRARYAFYYQQTTYNWYDYRKGKIFLPVGADVPESVKQSPQYKTLLYNLRHSYKDALQRDLRRIGSREDAEKEMERIAYIIFWSGFIHALDRESARIFRNINFEDKVTARRINKIMADYGEDKAALPGKTTLRFLAALSRADVDQLLANKREANRNNPALSLGGIDLENNVVWGRFVELFFDKDENLSTEEIRSRIQKLSPAETAKKLEELRALSLTQNAEKARLQQAAYPIR